MTKFVYLLMLSMLSMLLMLLTVVMSNPLQAASSSSETDSKTSSETSSLAVIEDPAAVPIQIVEALHARLIANMRANSSYDERAEQLTPLIESSFDLTTISRIALGTNWRKLGEQDQRQIEELMKNLTISNYASRFSRYKKEAFSTQADKSVSTNRHQVRTVLTTAKGEKISLDYFLTNKSGTWKIFDVVANGVSDLALRRSAYGAIFRQSGLSGVIAEIEQGIRDNVDNNAR